LQFYSAALTKRTDIYSGSFVQRHEASRGGGRDQYASFTYTSSTGAVSQSVIGVDRWPADFTEADYRAHSLLPLSKL